MMRLLKLVAAMAVVFVTGCAVTPLPVSQPLAPAEGSKIFKFVVLDQKRDVEMGPDNGTWNASLRAIPGALYGRPSRNHALMMPVHSGGDFELSMTALETTIAPLAATATLAMRAGGIRVKPDATRMARVGTLVFDSASGRDVLGAGFINPNAAPSKDVSLMYFDRPCEIQGAETQDGVTYAYSLRIPAAGLHWMQFDTVYPKRVQVNLVDPRTTIWFAGYH